MKTFLLRGACVLCLLVLTAQPVSADKSYGLPTLLGMPGKPDIIKNQGGVVRFPPWKMIVAPDTFTYDIYFQTGCWDKSFPMRIGRYWQISDICEFWPKPHVDANKAPAVSEKTWILSYEYTDDELAIIPGLSFPEESLKIIHSADHGKTWTMLRGAAVDPINNTVAVVTDRHGGFMLMGGFVSPDTYYNYADVKGVSVVRGHEGDVTENDENIGADRLSTTFEHIALLISRVL